uniref:Uncharacterized protein n=1 Tax=Hucho hucho TaxID=62062 RepID=A0A4W5PVJ5_9TELE
SNFLTPPPPNFLSPGLSVSGVTWPCLCLCCLCERGLKRLQECWECYSDKLTETGVYQPLLSITAKLHRGAKPQLKVQVEEFEKRLTAVHTRGLENVESPEMEKNRPEGAGPSQNTTHTPLPNKGLGGRPKRGQAKPSVSSRHDDSFVTPKPTRKSSKKAVITFSSDEEEEEESETPKVTTPIARTSRRARLRH